MKETDTAIDFTGEFFVPGKSGGRIEADHLERYRFACTFAQHKSILDIACGAGYSAPLFMEAGAINYEGVDLSEQLVRYANWTYGSDRANFLTGNICTYDNGRAYDVIACYETIEHVPDYESALRNLYSLLKEDGILLISSPNRPIVSPRSLSLRDKPANKFHSQEFTPEELLQALHNSGFTANSQNIYGQRQRRLYKNKLIRRLCHLVFSDPNLTSSPTVTPVINKTPRYFILVATKK